MATAVTTTQPRRMQGRVGDEEDDQVKQYGVVAREDEASKQQQRAVSRLAVEGGSTTGDVMAKASSPPAKLKDDDEVPHGRRSWGPRATALPPPHAWLAVDDTKKRHEEEEDQWARLLRGGGGQYNNNRQRHPHRRSSFSVARRDRTAREASLDRAWEMKRSWHQRNGGAPDADTPVVVVLGGGGGTTVSGGGTNSPSAAADHHAAGVAMDVEEVRACRDLGLELPHDCTVEIQCYGLSADTTSPTHSTAGDDASPLGDGGGGSSPGADPTDVKARLKVWAHAVALASTTQLGS